jgi:phosphopantothenoylcysteine decarboxylase/phosphopantothenate--cysteine ligase
MESAVHEAWGGADIMIMAAAVSDFTPARPSPGKIKKRASQWNLSLVRTPDILAELGSRKEHRILVGFAAETDDIETHAKGKLESKNLDVIVANDVSQQDGGFESDFNRVQILFRDGRSFQTEKMSKREISRVLMNAIEEIIARQKPTPPS